ncbi:MAG: sigma-54-dependent Fis family transcriptional regulator [bacterium]|nr:sigma-54-dependent Fis family transcriptional regulator [bacterium]
MADPRERVLVVDDTAANRRLLAATFEAEGIAVSLAEDGPSALAVIRANPPSVVLLDLRMPGMTGLETLAAAKKLAPQLPVIVLTADGDIASAVEATRLGAFDFLTRPINGDKLVLTVRHAIEMRQLSGEVQDLRRQLSSGSGVARLMGTSEAMRKVVRQIQQVAASAFTVLIQGETGTGKELAARAVHQESTRREQPFIALDCGAIPETLIESELFGYEKGAFTGATQRRAGHVQRADGGTLFLDEIGNLSLATQAKLLRTLQERQVQSLGGTRPVAVDVRFVAATNEPLLEAVEAGRFREDLYFRLAEFGITMPPLRERRGDVVALARRFQEETCIELRRSVTAISDDAAALLVEHAWPGNVRELRNVVRQAVLQSDVGVLGADDLRPLLTKRANKGAISASVSVLGRSLKEIANAASSEAEKQAIAEALRSTRGNKSKAARLLKVDFKTLHLKMKRYGLRTDPQAP